MNQSYFQCKKHQQEILFICTEEQYEADRRQCHVCLDSKKKFEKVAEFQQKVIDALQNYEQIPKFQEIHKNIQFKVDSILSELKETISSIMERINFQDSKIQELKTQVLIHNKSVLELGQDNVNTFVKMINTPYLDNIKKKLIEQRDIVEKNLLQIEREINDCFDRVKSLQQNTLEIKKGNVIIREPMILGIKQGEAYYVDEDQIKNYGGTYEINEKEGLWKVPVKQTPTKELKKQQFYFAVFRDGLQLNIVQEYGNINSNGLKEGIQLEVFGDSGQLKRLVKYKNGIEQGQCEIYFNGYHIGGGEFNEAGQKINQWIEIQNDYDKKYGRKIKKQYQNDLEVTQVNMGNYSNDNLIGRSELQFERFTSDQKYGGVYDGLGRKTGEWIEKIDKSEYMYKGFYNKGKQIGYWLIYKNLPKVNWPINFYQELSKIIQISQNQHNSGIKIDLKHSIESVDDPFATPVQVEIFGGYFDEKNFKQGFWIEVIDTDKNFERIIYGQYLNNIRIGKWNQAYNDCEGYYDSNGVKQGDWTEYDGLQGQYLNGKRVGLWKNEWQSGQFDNENLKTGEWTEKEEIKLNTNHFKVSKGKYSRGKRIGSWESEIVFKRSNYCPYYDCTICGQKQKGNYNEFGQKDGTWEKMNNLKDYVAGQKISDVTYYFLYLPY